MSSAGLLPSQMARDDAQKKRAAIGIAAPCGEVCSVRGGTSTYIRRSIRRSIQRNTRLNIQLNIQLNIRLNTRNYADFDLKDQIAGA